ncbi:PREDICTED: apoptosis facilitator Bcl-2-like protein 14 [Mesitornis unicolor]|uniref:apoptosis facilitator Bcl-2-like protein 14 n=1 Tax=Mesitornis unicolor TaxID=54374 RepID=UPI00052921C4|nr:PREDICTED: apoptosis facilitator Bcl-2-like protein 14 [Mesitornis unicolor]
MSSPNDVSMEEIPLEDDERGSIEYKILMAYAQQRLSVSKYGQLLKNEANMQKSSSLTRKKADIDHQMDKDGLIQRAVYQGGVMQEHSKKQPKRKYLPGYCLPFLCGCRAEQEKSPMQSLPQGHVARSFDFEFQRSMQMSKSLNYFLKRLIAVFISHSSSQSGETADVNHIADKLAKLVTSRSQEFPSRVSFRAVLQGSYQKQDDSDAAGGTEGQELDEEKIIQTIVSLLRQAGDQLEEKIKKDRIFYQYFQNMLSYNSFKRITDLFLEDVSGDSTSEPRGQVQCMKVAFTMEVATRLNTVDNHPMNLVLGFGSKYLREHFKPWIQDQGGWEKALTSLDQEEVE